MHFALGHRVFSLQEYVPVVIEEIGDDPGLSEIIQPQVFGEPLHEIYVWGRNIIWRHG